MNMKKIILLTIITFTLMNVNNLRSQVNLDIFIKSVVEETKTLEKTRASDIKKFMKYGYSKNSELKNNIICKIPIYTIFIHHKYMNQDRSKDSLFAYMNPKSLSVENILFFNDNDFIAVAYPKYKNAKDQPMGIGNIQDAKLANIAIKEKPDILFSLQNSNRIYFSLKNSLFSCYLYDEKQSDYIRVTPIELLETIDESDFNFMTNLDSPVPLIYSK